MTYYPTIPQAGDIPAQSQSQFLSNFTEIDTDFGRDHVALTDADAASRGFHNHTTLPVQVAAPATTATQVALYCKNDVTGHPNLYFRRPSSGNEIELTAHENPVIANNGCTFLPGGILIQWGIAAIPIVSGGIVTIVFPSAFAAPGPYSIIVTPYNASLAATTLAVEHFTVNTFDLYSSRTNISACWIAMGPA